PPSTPRIESLTSYVDLLSSAYSQPTADSMFSAAQSKLRTLFASQSASLFVLSPETHELVCREGGEDLPPNDLIFHAANSEFPYNLSGEDKALRSFNAKAGGIGRKEETKNALVARLLDTSNRVVGVVAVQNHLSSPRYPPPLESTLSLLLPPLASLCSSIAVAMSREAALKKTEERAYKLERAGDSTWLLSTVVDDVLKKISAPVGTGIVGSTAASGTLNNVPSPPSDPRFEAKIDSRTDEFPNAVLTAPVLSPKDGRPLAVLHLCGRKFSHRHTAEDVRLAEMFSEQLVPVVETLLKRNPTNASSASSSAPASSSSLSYSDLVNDPSKFVALSTTQMISLENNLTTLCETVETQLASVIQCDHISL
ncbi:hypothetical protein TeGR_g431, partial [Tetraparma gracilis]